MDKLSYLHETLQPLLPAVGDVRILPTLNLNYDPSCEKSKTPVCKLDVVKCVKHLDHHAVFENVESKKQIAIPFEMAEKYGYLSIDEAMKWILNSFMETIIKQSKENVSYNLFSSLKDDSKISEYYEQIKDLVLLSRNVLKMAEKAKSIYQKELEKERNG